MTQGTFFNQLLIWPIINLLVAIYKGILFLGIPGALGLAVIVLTVIIRLVLHPLTVTQLKSAQKMAKLKPEMDKLAAKYKNDKARLNQEQLNLYKNAGINPAAGCLPTLLQFPIVIALYQVFFEVLSKGDTPQVVADINKILYSSALKINSFDLNFFGLNLAHKPDQWQQFGWWLLLVPLITGLLQFWQTKLMTPVQPKTEAKDIVVDKDGKEVKKEDDMGTAMQKQMMFMMPIMIGFFAYTFPLGLSLYWNTYTVFGIIQQYQINKKG
jgi:YidC/Oxa1 family membrane protein insertase